MNGISIIITAYNTKKYIKETLDSISQQDYFRSHDNFEILLGIDADSELLEYVKSIRDNYLNLHLFYTPINVGTFVLFNSLTQYAKYDILFRFDSDDVLLPNAVTTIMKHMSRFDYLRLSIRTYDETLTKIRKDYYVSRGQIAFKKKVFEESGGFQPWICAADAEFITRIKTKFTGAYTKNILSKYRRRSDSLTHDKNTDARSDIRKQYHEYINNEATKPENFKIKTVTTEIYEI